MDQEESFNGAAPNSPDNTIPISTFPEAKVEPETGMPEGEQGGDSIADIPIKHSEDIEEGSVEVEGMSGGDEEGEKGGEDTIEREMDFYPAALPSKKYVEERYEQIVEDVSDKEEEEKELGM